MRPLLLYIAVLGCPLPAAADTCNKNKHCENDEFCNCDTNGGSCKNRLSQCQTCASVGQPSFATGTDTCERYESACGYNCDGSDYPATAPAPVVTIARRSSAESVEGSRSARSVLNT